jgi:Na+-translocating ferredoxin:NAD+ oxidoreductase RnfC subunit
VLKTFPKGGVHPPENKITADIPIGYLPLPESVTIPLSQHIGSPSVPAVNKGDRKDRQLLPPEKDLFQQIFILPYPVK